MTLRVLHVGLESLSVRRGGLNRFCDNVVRAERSLGLAATAVWVGGDEEYAASISPASLWRRNRDIARIIRESDADLIDVHFAAHAVWALASGALAHRPLVVHFQGPWADESRWTGGSRAASFVKRRLERFVLRRAESVVVLSQAFGDIARQRYFVRPERLSIQPPGVSIPKVRDRAAIRAELGAIVEAPLVVAVRRLVPRMGLSVAIEAVADMPAAQLVIIGEGPERSALEATAERLGCRDRVRILGALSDVERDQWLAAATVSVVPTLAHEGFGLVVLESLAAGTPVVVSDVDGLVDAAAASRFVNVVPRGDAEALREALSLAHAAIPDAAEVRASVSACEWSQVASRLIEQTYAPLMTATVEPTLVTYLDHTAKRSGGELALVKLISAITASSGDAYFPHVVLFEHGDFEAELRRRGISYEVFELPARTQGVARDELLRSPLTGLYDTARFSWKLSRHLRRQRPDIVHANSLKAIAIGVIVSIWSPWRLLTHVRDIWIPPYLSEAVGRAMRLLTARRSDVIVANSALTGRAAGSRSLVLASPIDEPFFRVTPAQPGSTLRLAVIGRLAPWKGQDLVLDALELVTDLDLHVSFVGSALFGEDSYAEELVRRASVYGSRVTFLSAVDDVPSVLASLDATLLSSCSPEPFGNVVVESLAAGRPVIVPHFGGLVEFIEDGVNGLYYEPNSAASLADAIRRFAANGAERETKAERGRETAQRFAAPRVAEMAQRIYESVLK